MYNAKLNKIHCVKNVCFRSCYGLYFPAFGLNTAWLDIFDAVIDLTESAKTKLHYSVFNLETKTEKRQINMDIIMEDKLTWKRCCL